MEIPAQKKIFCTGKHLHHRLRVNVQLEDGKGADQHRRIGRHLPFRCERHMDNDLFGVLPQRRIQLLDVLVDEADVGRTKIIADLAHVKLEVEKVLFARIVRAFVGVHDAKVEPVRYQLADKGERVAHRHRTAASHRGK